MAILTAVAVAVATWCAAAASDGPAIGGLDLPLAVLAPALAAGVAAAAARRSTQVLPPGKDVVVLTAVSLAGFFGLYLVGWTSREHLEDVARLLPLAVVGLSVLWPEPNVLRYCLLLAGGTLLGTLGQPAVPRWAVGGALAGLAVGVVASNRLTAANGPRLGDAAPAGGRRIAREAGAVLVIVGLLAGLAAALVPPPPGAGGGGGKGNRRAPRPGEAGPPVVFEDVLDVAPGRGERSDDVVLRIFAPGPDLWRAKTYDHWDGESWERSPRTDIRIEPDGRYVPPGIGDVDEVPDTLEFFDQSVLVEARYAAVLVGAARVTYVVADTTVLESSDASLFPAVPLARGQSYEVSSIRSRATAGELRALGEVQASAIPDDVADAYLQLPQVAPTVRALAAEIAVTAPTTYDKVRAVERWLRENTAVTDNPTAVPPGTDPLEAFLLTERSGPPERTATSMAVMLRALGVPTRIAVGFLPGTRTGSEFGTHFVVRSSDTHAWVEVWFPGAGWQRFDPTGRAPGTDTESVWDRLWRFLKRLWPLLVAVVLTAAAWLARRGLRWWRRRSSLPWATRFFARLERAGAARGRPRQPQETPAEYADGLAHSVLPDPRLTEVGELVTVAAYSRHEPPAEDRARAEALLRQATKAAPVRRFRRLTRSRQAPRPTIAKP